MRSKVKHATEKASSITLACLFVTTTLLCLNSQTVFAQQQGLAANRAVSDALEVTLTDTLPNGTNFYTIATELSVFDACDDPRDLGTIATLRINDRVVGEAPLAIVNRGIPDGGGVACSSRMANPIDPTSCTLAPDCFGVVSDLPFERGCFLHLGFPGSPFCRCTYKLIVDFAGHNLLDGDLIGLSISPTPTAEPEEFTLDDKLSAVFSNGSVGCISTGRNLCLHDRFKVEVLWEGFQGNVGAGWAVPLNGVTGHFWFFDESNIELTVKMLDGRLFNGAWWIFYGALSNVEYTIVITDTETRTSRSYFNPSGQFMSFGDINAFADPP